MTKYFLMHKDIVCGTIVLDENSGSILSYKDHNTGYSTYLGNTDLKKMQIWWKMRSVPASRNIIREIVKKAGGINAEIYLAKNLALSVTDSYWVCPADMSIKYEDISFFKLKEYNKGKVPYHNTSSYDYNASLGGQMEKYWDLSENIPVLVKECTQYSGQQAINEVFATRIHALQDTSVPFVRYTGEIIENHKAVCKCNAFTSENVELISAYEMVESKKRKNDQSLYNHYIECCVESGIEREEIQQFMDYQTLTDFVISNIDEHLQNFGVLRDSDSMKLIGPAPIFDSGNSMFYSENPTGIYSRVELLERKITGFFDSEEKMLSKVINKNIVKLDLLPSVLEVKELYISAGIDEKKASFISGNYEKKLQMIDEFQHGKKISLYQEKLTNRKSLAKKQEQPKLIVMCGLPNSGKTKKAQELFEKEIQKGKQAVDASSFYNVEDAVKAVAFIVNKENIINKVNGDNYYKNAITIISANDIRKEIEAKGFVAENDMIFLTAAVRIKTALQNGISVIYNASNSSKSIRKEILNLAKSANIENTELYVVSKEVSQKKTMLKLDISENDEGWSCIKIINDKHQDLEK